MREHELISRLDSQRPLRNGFSEVIFCEGKNIDHLLQIVGEWVEKGENVLGTRANELQANILKQQFPTIQYDPVSRCFSIVQRAIDQVAGNVAVVCAGTADVSVAEEARRTASFFGVEAVAIYDVGVAGLHRLLSHIERLAQMNVVIAVAGMEGALPSVLGGLISAPIIAVPTSVGYGTNRKGETALFAMLNSCAEGVTVVNIDNGFGAACAALRILRTPREYLFTKKSCQAPKKD